MKQAILGTGSGVARGMKVDHVNIHFNAGRPGVPEPYYHVILWHVTPAQAAALK